MEEQEVRAAVDKLIDPDQQSQARYLWDDDFQRILLGMMLSNQFFLSQSVNLVKASYFTSEIHQLACRQLLAYFTKHKQIPSKIFIKQEITDFLREKYKDDNNNYQVIKLAYMGELNTVYDYYTRGGIGDVMPGLDCKDALLDKIAAFAKTQAMKVAFHSCLDLIRKKPEEDQTWDKVNDILKKALLVERQSDIGLDYFQTIDERYDRMLHATETLDVFTTGFRTLDMAINGGGMARGELGAWMGLPGTGKSLALVAASVKNVVQGRKVLYFSTEMDADRIATRFDSQFSLIGQHELLPKRDDVKRALLGQVREYDDKSRLIIKQFPSGSADINTLRAFHAQLMMQGFDPDLVIVDYPGDMKLPREVAKHQTLQDMLTDLRGFGAEEKHLTLIAIQPNRGASEMGLEEFMDESKQGDSFGQNRVLDYFWTLNQTSMEQKANIGRVYVAKCRNGKSRFSFRIKYEFESQTLGLSEISDTTYRLALNNIKERDSEEVEINKITSMTNTFKPGEGERAG